jgi:hypothetical protein
MASLNSSNLHSLVTQLAEVESAFINILTQAALKLSELSNAEVFLLVKGASGSFYSGSESLCNAYEGRTLVPSSSHEKKIPKEVTCKHKECGWNKYPERQHYR